jgi:hypothetical protein
VTSASLLKCLKREDVSALAQKQLFMGNTRTFNFSALKAVKPLPTDGRQEKVFGPLTGS